VLVTLIVGVALKNLFDVCAGKNHVVEGLRAVFFVESHVFSFDVWVVCRQQYCCLHFACCVA
jgi:hypothetical protein